MQLHGLQEANSHSNYTHGRV